jgi:hypothetical protein
LRRRRLTSDQAGANHSQHADSVEQLTGRHNTWRLVSF